MNQLKIPQDMKNKNSLYYLTINVTNRCNLSCQHCYASSGHCSEEDLDLPIIKRVLKEAKGLGLVSVLITGGEPLLRGDIKEILRYSKSLGLKVFLATNGTQINKENIKFLKEYVDKMNISLDGIPETHDKIRGRKGVFNETMEKIKEAVSEGVPLSVSFTAQDENYPQIEELVSRLKKEGILDNLSVNVKRFISVGRGADNKLRLSGENYVSLAKIIERLKSKKVKISFKDPFYSLGSGEGYGCYAGIHILSIKNNGDIWICTKVEKTIGNIKETSLDRIWNNSEILKQLRENAKEGVKGCRAAAYASSGDLFSEDPLLRELKSKP
jgi:MoaA/NifB/PqqE/SkfB family radical SAM enzyme